MQNHRVLHVLTNAIATLHLDEKLAKQNHENRWAIDQTYDDLAGKISVNVAQGNRRHRCVRKNRDPVLAEKIADTIPAFIVTKPIYGQQKWPFRTSTPLNMLSWSQKHKLSEAEGAFSSHLRVHRQS